MSESLIVGFWRRKENFRAAFGALGLSAWAVACGANERVKIPPSSEPFIEAPATPTMSSKPLTVAPRQAEVASGERSAIDRAEDGLLRRMKACGVELRTVHCDRQALPVNCSALLRSSCGAHAVATCEILADRDTPEVAMHAFACMMQLHSCEPCAVERCAAAGMSRRCAHLETR